uniref:Lipoprotein n=1 Tax=Panagrellus redivivus TaxID=6233 RepID=A0A7E4V371_PANRE
MFCYKQVETTNVSNTSPAKANIETSMAENDWVSPVFVHSDACKTQSGGRFVFFSGYLTPRGGSVAALSTPTD